jgi:hypothetical protein
MYPSQALLDGLYTYEDLPDAIDVGGIEYAKLDPPESVGGFTRYYINANDEYLGILEGEGEDSLWTYEGGGGPCLINAFNGEGGEREDQFADTYTVTSCSEPSAIGTILTRTSLCYWEGQYNTPFAGTQTVSIFYCPSVGPIPSDVCNDTFKFYSFYSRDVGGLTDPIIAEKTPHSNTPSGNYTAENGSISFA